MFFETKNGNSVILWDPVNEIYNLMEKEFSDPQKKEALLNTQELIVNESSDRFWGYQNGNGFNMLGRILMDIREDLKKHKRKVLVVRENMSDYSFFSERLDYLFSKIKPVIVSLPNDIMSEKYAHERNLELLNYPLEYAAENSDILVAFGESETINKLIDSMTGKQIRIIKSVKGNKK